MRPVFRLRSLAGPAATILLLSSSLLAHAAFVPAAPHRPSEGADAAPLGLASRGVATGAATRARIAAHLAQSPTYRGAAHAEGAAAPPAGVPGRVDLSADAPPVADQGALGSCASWSLGYYLRGYYARRDGYYPRGTNAVGEGGFAAGYLYTQLAGGNPDAATSADQNVALLATQGIAANADYPQGNDQVARVPSAGQVALAARYRIAGHRFIRAVPGANRGQIESLLAAGDPVVLNIALPDAFYGVTAATYLFAGPSPVGGPSHDIAAFGYDSAGVWVENSWGTGWGRDGWAELSWGWLETAGLRFIDTITPLTPAPLPGGTPAPASPAPAAPTRDADAGAPTSPGSATSAGAAGSPAPATHQLVALGRADAVRATA